MNRYDQLARADAAIIAATGIGLLFYCSNGRHGNAILAGMCFFVAIVLFIFSPQFADKPPTWDEIRKEMRGFYERMLS